jgi:hypothetical protein
MSFIPVSGGGWGGESKGTSTASSRGTTLTNSGVANTKGAYSTLGSALTYPMSGMLVIISAPTVNATRFSVDIAIGSGGSEVIIASDLYYYDGIGGDTSAHYVLPIRANAGAQLSARFSSQNTTTVIDVAVQALVGGLHLPSYAGAIGMGLTGSVTLPTISRPGAIHTKGAYTEIISSTTKRFRGLAITTGQSGASTQHRLIDVAVGAAASEVVVIPDWHVAQNTGQDTMFPQTSPIFPVDIPEGTRLSMRLAQDVIGAGRDLLAGLIGYY